MLIFFRIELLTADFAKRVKKRKRYDRLKRVTLKLYKQFTDKHPEFAINFQGVTVTMIPLIEEEFNCRIEIYYRKPKDKPDSNCK